MSFQVVTPPRPQAAKISDELLRHFCEIRNLMQLVKCFVSLVDGNFAELPKLLKLFLTRSSHQRCLPYRIGEGDLFRAHIWVKARLSLTVKLIYVRHHYTVDHRGYTVLFQARKR